MLTEQEEPIHSLCQLAGTSEGKLGRWATSHKLPGREGWLSPICLPTAGAPATRGVVQGVWTGVWGLRPAAWAHVAESAGQDQTGH